MVVGSGAGVLVIAGGVVMGCGCGVAVVDAVIVLSLQPNQPGVTHVVVAEEVVLDVVVVVVVVSSLHPNHPGVSQVEVDELVVVVVVADPVVVVSSRQPHHPGVLHVAVLVRVFDEVVLVDDDVGSVLLLSYIFQFEQSRHSGVNLHSAASSYFRMTSLITDLIL